MLLVVVLANLRSINALLKYNMDVHAGDHFGRALWYYIRDNRYSAKDNALIIRALNYYIRSRFIVFLYGCNLCTLNAESSVESADINAVRAVSVVGRGNHLGKVRTRSDSRRNTHAIIVRCFEDHYWVRSMLEFVYYNSNEEIGY